MSLLQIVARSLRQHLVSALICAFSIALAGGLLLTVWVTQQQTKRAFTGLDGGYDAVLGARGSKLQLVLNAVFHLEESPGNLKVEDWQDIQKHPAVARAIPLAMGDSFQGHRIVGTSIEYFEATQSAAGQKLKPVSGGRLFDPTAREAVVGNLVAKKLGLVPGSIIHPTHGLGREGQQHEEEYVVVGILEASNTPADRVIWIPLEGIQLMSGHSAEAEHELSAVLVKLKADSPTAGFLLDGKYNREGTRLTWAWPIGRVMAQLFDKVGWFDLVLRLVAWLVVLVSIASVTAGIYNSMEERRRDVAILRMLGAGRRFIFTTVTLEASAIAALGMVGAFGFYAVVLTIISRVLQTEVGISLEVWSMQPIFFWAPVTMIGLSALAGMLPAWKACRVDVARTLSSPV